MIAMPEQFVAGDEYEPDPVFVHSLRETVVIISLFLFFLFWTVCVSFYLGHESTYVQANVEELALVWGMPSWVFYGVFLPWLVVNLVSVWFCFGFMKDDELEDPDPPSDESLLEDGR